jgi:hypothetical protein
MPIRAQSNHKQLGPWLGLLAWTTSATAQTLGSGNAPQPPPGNELYLWLGLGCFGTALLLVLSRAAVEAWRRQRRGRALRSFRLDPGLRRPGKALRRWWRRQTPARPVRMEVWEQRTRRAELQAQQAVAALRSELTPHLARMMKDRLIWTLMNQRARLLSINQANAEKVATLEHRLTAIQLQIRKQAEAYESRIADLEKQLAEKSTVTRELLKFRVILAKQALEAVRLDKPAARS